MSRRRLKSGTLLLSTLLALAAAHGRAGELLTPHDAEELCSTADPAPAESDDPEQGYDPLIRSQRRHDYAMARLGRVRELYSATLDTSQYGFLPGERDMLVVDTLLPFPLFGGAFSLDLGTTPEIAFLVPEESGDEILAGVASDQVLLRLHFQLVGLDDPETPYCVSDGQSIRILGRLLAAELVDRCDRATLLRAETDRYRSARVRFGLDVGTRYIPPQPRVLVTSTAFPAAEPRPAEAEMLRFEAETRLMACYHRGLNVNGRLQGAIVVSYRVGEDGQVFDPAVTIDAIDQPVLTGCVVGSLGSLSLPREQPAPPYDVRMTVIFRLE